MLCAPVPDHFQIQSIEWRMEVTRVKEKGRRWGKKQEKEEEEANDAEWSEGCVKQI